MSSRPKRTRTKPKEVYVVDNKIKLVDDDSAKNEKLTEEELDEIIDEFEEEEEEEISSDEDDEDDEDDEYDEYDDLEKTKEGYAKDGFIASDDEDMSDYMDSDGSYYCDEDEDEDEDDDYDSDTVSDDADSIVDAILNGEKSDEDYMELSSDDDL